MNGVESDETVRIHKRKLSLSKRNGVLALVDAVFVSVPLKVHVRLSVYLDAYSYTYYSMSTFAHHARPCWIPAPCLNGDVTLRSLEELVLRRLPQGVIPAKAGIQRPQPVRKPLDSRPRFHEGRPFAGVTIRGYPSFQRLRSTGKMGSRVAKCVTSPTIWNTIGSFWAGGERSQERASPDSERQVTLQVRVRHVFELAFQDDAALFHDEDVIGEAAGEVDVLFDE